MKESVKSVDMGKTPNSSFSVTCVFVVCTWALAFSSQFREQTVISKTVLGDQTACSNRSTNSKRVSESGTVNKPDRKREKKREKESLMDQVSSVKM